MASGGVFIAYLIDYACVLINYIAAFGFKVKMKASLIDYYVILIDYLCVCCV